MAKAQIKSLKVLNIAQPNAHYIFHSGKNIENRSMPTTIRGTIAIYASKTYDSARFEGADIEKSDCEFGVILGFVDLVDCVTEDDLGKGMKKWFHGPYGYVFENPRLLKTPIEVSPPKGAIIWWDLSGPKVQSCVDQVSMKSFKELTKSTKKLAKKVSKRSAKAELIPSKELAAIIGAGVTNFKNAIGDLMAYMEAQELEYDEQAQTIVADKRVQGLCKKKVITLKELVETIEANLTFK